MAVTKLDMSDPGSKMMDPQASCWAHSKPEHSTTKSSFLELQLAPWFGALKHSEEVILSASYISETALASLQKKWPILKV